MSRQIDYELDQYDEYMERAQHVVESGSVAEAGAFAALADLSYEKVRMFSGIDDISASRRGDHQQPSCCENLKPPAFEPSIRSFQCNSVAAFARDCIR